MTLDAQLLKELRLAAGAGIDANALAAKVSREPSAVVDRIAELRRLGYEIESSPHLGYRLVSGPDVLHADDLLSRLPAGQLIGRDIQVFQETSSTNDVIERLARDGVREGVAVFAETQTRGRGRLGRKWISPPGEGLWFSVLLRPQLPPALVTQVTIAGATAIARAIRLHTGLKPEIKWPNDILIGGRKVVGILTELSAEQDRVRHVILGIGVDVNVTELPEELRSLATSLAAAAGRRFHRAELAAVILRELDADYARVKNGGFAELAEEWERQCVTLGQRIRIDIGARALSGRAESLDNDGALLLRSDYGHLERVVGGDVIVERGA
jgi:BirA family biotin operon repressor/biotin-[acetyl-CoA-carboxylase] ligase